MEEVVALGVNQGQQVDPGVLPGVQLDLIHLPEGEERLRNFVLAFGFAFIHEI